MSALEISLAIASLNNKTSDSYFALVVHTTLLSTLGHGRLHVVYVTKSRHSLSTFASIARAAGFLRLPCALATVLVALIGGNRLAGCRARIDFSTSCSPVPTPIDLFLAALELSSLLHSDDCPGHIRRQLSTSVPKRSCIPTIIVGARCPASHKLIVSSVPTTCTMTRALVHFSVTPGKGSPAVEPARPMVRKDNRS
ncbi:hypothetical protein HPB51_007432 [Rhipicephalus microplus]|uniref:Uncharacterized protein n=1 Tax=Rhipicephalus microplus TaxID=6941 RepID=A0A9J6EYK2_RHIMP|nr:hypothetical protein HPB51_007432 [Rhipicephalus microplus]